MCWVQEWEREKQRYCHPPPPFFPLFPSFLLSSPPRHFSTGKFQEVHHVAQTARHSRESDGGLPGARRALALDVVMRGNGALVDTGRRL